MLGINSMQGKAYLPRIIYTTRFSLVQTRSSVARIKANDEGGDSERSDTSGLCIALFE